MEPGAAGEVVAELDAQGWGSLWFGEAYGREAFTAAYLYLGASSRIVVGTGIASIYGHDAFATAAAARLLGQVHPGRFVLGLGVSHAPLVEGMRGHEYGKPVAMMHAYLAALAASPSLGAGARTCPHGHRRPWASDA